MLYLFPPSVETALSVQFGICRPARATFVQMRSLKIDLKFIFGSYEDCKSRTIEIDQEFKWVRNRFSILLSLCVSEAVVKAIFGQRLLSARAHFDAFK